MLDALQVVEEQTEQIATILTSPETAGQLGLSQPITGDLSKSEIEQEIQEKAEEFKQEVENAENSSDFVLSWAKVLDAYFEVDVDLDEQTESEVPESLMVQLGQSIVFLEQLSEISNRDFHDVAIDFIDEMQEHGVLGKVNTIIVHYFASRTEDAMLYANTFHNDITDVLSELIELKNADSMDVSTCIDLYRKSGTYFEYALPPMLAVIDGVTGEEVDFQKTSSMQLANGISRVVNFPPLKKFGTLYDSNIRNALSHGGSSGYRINRIEDEIIFQFRVSNTVKSMSMTHADFCQQTIEATAGAIALFVLPLFAILMHTYLEIEGSARELQDTKENKD